MGAIAHSAIDQYREYIGEGVAVEVGCSVPGPISSSQWLGEYFSKIDIEYHGYEVVPKIVNTLREHFKNHILVNFHLKEWKQGFQELEKPIAFAHLDAFDFIPPSLQTALKHTCRQ